jgi:Right handed beta helix region
MTWTKKTWTDNTGPPWIEAAELNRHEDAIDLLITAGFVSAESLGISPSNTAAQNRTALLALEAGTQNIVFKPGDYNVDNAAGQLYLGAFSGHWYFTKGARFVFADNSKGGIKFQNGTSPRLENVVLVYANDGPTRVAGQDALNLYNVTEPVLVNIRVENSPAVGILVEQCTYPRISGIRIFRARADGLHVANCANAHVSDVYTETTGDDGLAFLNYSWDTDLSGARADLITTKDSGARGISVVGQRDVEITNFDIDGTLGPGVYVAYESTYNGTGATARVPRNVRIVHGTVRNAGAFSGYRHAPMSDKHGISVFSNHATIAMDCVLSSIKVLSATYKGAYLASTGKTILENVRIVSAGTRGIDVEGTETQILDCVVESSAEQGFVSYNSKYIFAAGLSLRNTALTGGSNLAIHLQNAASSPNATTEVQATGVHIIDTQEMPTGYKVRVDPDSGSGKDIRGTLGEVFIHTTAVLPASPIALDTTNMTWSRRYGGYQNSVASAAPTAGRWCVGDVVYHSAPAAGGSIGWVCTAAGTPGTWKAFGTIAS